MKLHGANWILNLNEVDESNTEMPNEEAKCYLGIKRPKIITSLLFWWQVSMVHEAAMKGIDSKIDTGTWMCFPKIIQSCNELIGYSRCFHSKWKDFLILCWNTNQAP